MENVHFKQPEKKKSWLYIKAEDEISSVKKKKKAKQDKEKAKNQNAWMYLIIFLCV